MKGITLNLEDLTDSREVMESKEPPKIRWFIYIVLTILLCAIAFASVFEMDEYVRVSGEVKTSDTASEVVLTSSCRLSDVMVQDGQSVSKGDLLFTFDVDYAKEQLAITKSTISEYEQDYNYTQRLKQSIEQGINLFANTGDESEYYYRYEQYQKNGELAQHEIDSSKLNNAVSSEDKQNNLQSAKNSKKEKQELLSAYQTLAKRVENGDEYKGKNKLVKASYNDYETSLEKAELAVKQSKANYERMKKAYEEQKSQDKITASDVSSAKQKADSAQQELSSIQQSYSETAQRQIQQLQLDAADSSDELTIQQQIQAWTQFKNAVELGSSCITSDSEVNALYTEFRQAYDAQTAVYQQYEQEYQSIQSAYTLQSSQTSVTKSDVNDAELTYKNAKLSVQSVTDNYLSQIQSTINSLQSEIQTLDDTITSLETSLKGIQDLDEYESDAAENRKNDAIVSLNSELTSLSNSINSAKSQLIELNETIKNSEMTAACDGTITLLKDMNVGDTVQAGTQLCSILPDTDNLKAVLYIPESEISKVHQGQQIEYVFDSMPYAEFGRITGELQTVSADAISNDSNGGKYYIANAQFNSLFLQNSKGETRTVQTGMLVEAKVISGSKKVIIWLLEKINLVD